MKVRTLIVDDIPQARRRVAALLAADPEVEVVGECGDGAAAVGAIAELAPDLVFLDVQMPGGGGFDVIKAVGAERMPVVIFVTAYDEFALRAFEVHAFDYLLKPFDRERFRKTVERAKEALRRRQPDELGERLRALLLDVRAQPRYLKRVKVKSSGHTLILPAEEIDFIETAGNYLRLQSGKSSYLIRESLSAFEAQLDPELFARIHRSTVVNLERIKELHPLFNGDQTIILRDGTRLTMSRSYRDRLLSLL
jgi:two-component system LytT family response regulator